MKEGEFKLDELLNRFRDQHHVKDKLLDKKLEEVWKELYENLAIYTGKVQFKRGILSIWINSSVLKQELNYNKDKIVVQLNGKLEEALIKKIEFR